METQTTLTQQKKPNLFQNIAKDFKEIRESASGLISDCSVRYFLLNDIIDCKEEKMEEYNTEGFVEEAEPPQSNNQGFDLMKDCEMPNLTLPGLDF